MNFSLLALLSLTLAAPVTSITGVDSTAAAGTAAAGSTDSDQTLQPLIYVSQDGSLWIGNASRKKLLGDDAINVVGELAAITKRNALEPKIHFHPGPCCDDDPFDDPCAPPYDPCDPCDPRNQDPGCHDGGDCVDELRASCYSKWLCPGTYCCNRPYGYPDRHPVVDALSTCCATKWLCPKTYLPCNAGCGGPGYDPCLDPCADPCADPPARPRDPCRCDPYVRDPCEPEPAC